MKTMDDPPSSPDGADGNLQAPTTESKTKKTVMIIGSILLVVAIAGIGVRSSTPAPVPLERDSMIALIQSRSASTTFFNSVSPQNKALDWILSDTYSSGGLSDDRLVQRFALATLYSSMNGGNWSNGGGWLNSTHECEWGRGVQFGCSQKSRLTQLLLPYNYLSGLIPIELALLTKLTVLYLEGNELTGSIPSEFGILTRLTDLRLYDNELTGSIPSELALLTQLTQLRLYGNELTGSIPSELGLLTRLTYLRLYDNELTGSMPSSLCSTGLRPRIECGKIACRCCIDLSTGVSCPSA
jgi:Leucine-rich repeat (LRR) protein